MLTLLEHILADPWTHARWLNTLSYLEHVGARKLAACHHPTKVREEMLRHAAEEFRHAHFFKRQIAKVWPNVLSTYASLLGGRRTWYYLHRLDAAIARKTNAAGAYLLVSYAIEKRAEQIYPLYERLLRAAGIPIYLGALIREEAGHLEEVSGEMDAQIRALAPWACAIEESLYQEWLAHLRQECLTRTV